MESGGGSIIRGKLKELEAALLDYYGSVNEFRIGITKPNIPERPEALVLFEQCEALGVTLTGTTSLYGQPHIWLQEIAMIKYVRGTFELLEGQQTGQN